MADNGPPQLQNLSLIDATPTSYPTDSTPPHPSSTSPSGSTTICILAKFLELPPEVLKLICKHVFSYFVEDLDSYDEQRGQCTTLKLKVASPRYNLGVRSKSPEDDYHMPWYESLIAGCPHLRLPWGTLALLSVCTQIYETGAPVFYSLYTFRNTSAESFRLLFTKHIGASNLRAIRKLVIGLPYGVKTMPSKYIGRYRRMIDYQMPHLHETIIKTKFGRWY